MVLAVLGVEGRGSGKYGIMMFVFEFRECEDDEKQE